MVDTNADLQLIVRNPCIHGDGPVIRGTRVPVRSIVIAYERYTDDVTKAHGQAALKRGKRPQLVSQVGRLFPCRLTYQEAKTRGIGASVGLVCSQSGWEL